MKNRTRFLIGIPIFVIALIAGLIWMGLQALDIEDSYGDLQDTYYKAKSNDIIIDSNKRVGFIYKDSKRVFVEEAACMKDIRNWVESGKKPVKFKIYRPEYQETLTEHPTYKSTLNLIKEQGLKPIVSY